MPLQPSPACTHLNSRMASSRRWTIQRPSAPFTRLDAPAFPHDALIQMNSKATVSTLHPP
eukprot:360651-Chlamydomonas_euryale.AAC.3